MYSTVDTRVVELQFDNANFEKNVKTSLDSLNKLNKSLELDNAEKGANDLNRAFVGSGNSVYNALSTVTTKFSAMEIAGKRVIENLVDSAVRAGTRIYRELVVNPISSGFSKYGEKNTAIRTTMNSIKDRYESEAEAMESITGVVDKLMWYSDETSYSFTEMLTNMSKFTSAGGDLEKSADVMIGISNAAALAGQNTQAAARVMYNMAQAYGSGSVKLIDWKSVELANVGTEKLKQSIIDAGVELGTLIRTANGDVTTAQGKMAVSTSNFNDTLSKGWFTSAVMEKAFGEYAKFTDALYEKIDETGKSATDLINTISKVRDGVGSVEDIKIVNDIIEDLGIEATATASELEILSNSVGMLSLKSAQEARTFRDAMDAVMDVVSTGWMEVMEQIFGDVDESAKIWTAFANEVSTAFYNIPGAFVEILKSWNEMEGKEALMNSIANIWEHLMSIVDAVSESFHGVFGSWSDMGKTLASATKQFERFTSSLKTSTLFTDLLKTSLTTVFTVIKLVYTGAKTIVDLALPGLIMAISTLDKFLGVAVEIAKTVSSVVVANWEKIVTLIAKIQKTVPGLDKSLTLKLQKLYLQVYGKIVGIMKKLQNSVTAIWSTIKSKTIAIVQSLAKRITIIFNAVKNFIEKVPGALRTGWEKSSKFIVDTLTKLKAQSIKALDGLKTFFGTLPTTFAKAWERTKNSFSKLPDSFSNGWTKAVEKTRTIVENLYAKLKELFTKIQPIFSQIPEKFSSGWQTAKEKASGIFGGIQTFISTLFKRSASDVNSAASSFETVENAANNVRDTVVNMASGSSEFSNKWEQSATKVSGIFSKLVEKIKAIFTKLKAFFADLPNNFAALWVKTTAKVKETVSAVVPKISDTFKSVKDSLFGSSEGFDAQFKKSAKEAAKEAENIFKGAEKGAGGFAEKLGKIPNFLLKLGQNIVGPFDSVRTFADKLKEFIDLIKKILEDLHIIKAPPKEINSTNEFLTRIGGTLDYADKFLKAKTKSVKIGNIAKILLSIAALFVSVKYASDAIKSLGEMDTASLIQGVAGTIILIGAMGGLMLAFQKASEKSGGSKLNLGLIVGVLALSSALGKAAKGIKEIAGMELKDVGPAVLAITGTLAAMAAVAIVASKYAKTKVGVTIIPQTFTAMAAAVANVAKSFTDLGKLSLEEIGKGSLAMLGILSAMTVAVIAASRLSKAKVGITVIPDSFKAIADAVAKVAPSFIDLGKLDIATIAKGTLSLLAILGSMTAAIVLASRFSVISVGVTVIPQSFQAIADAVAKVAPSFIELGALSLKSIVMGTAALLAILGAMSASIILASRLSVIKVGITVIPQSFQAVADAVVKVAPVFTDLSKLSVAQLALGTAALIAILGAMSASIILVSRLSAGLLGIKSLNLSKSFAPISDSVVTVGEQFIKLGALSAEQVTNGVKSLNTIVAAMTAAVVVTSFIPLGSKKAKNVGDTFTNLANAISNVADPLIKLGTYKDSEIAKGQTVVKSLLTALVDSITTFKDYDSKLFKGGKLGDIASTFEPMANAVATLAPTFTNLGRMGDKQVTSGGEALSKILSTIGNALVSTVDGTFMGSGNGLSKVASSFADMAKTIVDISASFISIGKLSPKNIESGTTALDKIYEAIGKALSRKIKTGIFGNKAVKNSEAYKNAAGALADIVEPFQKLSKLSKTQVENGCAAMGSILEGIGSALNNVYDSSLNSGAQYPPNLSDIGAAYKSTAEAVKDISEPFSKLGRLTPKQVENATATLTVILTGIKDAVIATATGLSGADFDDDVVDIANTYKGVAEAVQTITAPFKTLSTIDSAKAKTAGDTLNAILKAISDTLTGTYSGIYTADMTFRPDLSDIATGYKDVAEAVKTIADPFDKLSKVTDVDNATTALNGILEGISGALTATAGASGTSWWTETTDLAAIGTAYKDVAVAVQDIADPFVKLSNAKNVEAGTIALNAILNGIAMALTGTSTGTATSWWTETTDVESIARAYKGVAEAVKDISDPFTKLANLTTTNVADGTAAVNGILQGISDALKIEIGEKEFPKNVESVATSFKGISEAVATVVPSFKTLSTLSTDQATTASTALGAILTSIGNCLTDEELPIFTGKLENVSNAYLTLSSALGNISTAITDLSKIKDTTKAKEGAEAAGTIITELSNVLEENDGFKSNTLGDTFVTVSGSLKNITDALNVLSGIKDTSTITENVKSVGVIIDELSSVISENTGLHTLFGTDASDVGKGFLDLAAALPSIADLLNTSLGDGIARLEVADYDTMITGLTNLYTPLFDLSRLGVTDYNGVSNLVGVVDSIERISKALYSGSTEEGGTQNGVAEDLRTIKSLIDEIGNDGDFIDTNMATSIVLYASKVSAAIGIVLDGAITKANGYSSSWSTVGKNITLGLKSGVENEDATSKLYAAIESIVKTAIAKAQKAADEHSPSKATAEIGRYMSEGLAVGIMEGQHYAVDASEKVTHDVIDNMSSTIKSISNMITEDIDTTPVIRPVVDLSDVESKSGAISGLFGTNSRKIVGSISYDTAAKKQQEEAANATIQNGGGSTYSFVQNNYSPKELSRTEIYRQTKNQFSMLKGLAKA